MKITAIVGSYRRGGIVESAVDELLAAAEACGFHNHEFVSPSTWHSISVPSSPSPASGRTGHSGTHVVECSSSWKTATAASCRVRPACEARTFPSGLKATETNPAVCPVKRRISVPVVASHRRAVPSLLVVSSCVSAPFHWAEVTQSL